MTQGQKLKNQYFYLLFNGDTQVLKKRMGQREQSNDCLQSIAHFSTKNKVLDYQISF
jgi:hypothetical protein